MRKEIWHYPAPPNMLFFLFFLLFFSLPAISQTISGTVTDADNKPISNASVHVKGTNRAALTDKTGKFSIVTAENDVLVLTYISYFPKEVPLNGRQSVNVSMGIDTRNMENVGVTALDINRRLYSKIFLSKQSVI